jgi:hypothetical protein
MYICAAHPFCPEMNDLHMWQPLYFGCTAGRGEGRWWFNLQAEYKQIASASEHPIHICYKCACSNKIVEKEAYQNKVRQKIVKTRDKHPQIVFSNNLSGAPSYPSVMSQDRFHFPAK